MANAKESKAKSSSTPAQPLTAIAIAAPIAGWLVPGAGHIIQKRWIRGLLLMFAVVVLFLAGLGMQGKVYAFNTGDLLDILGFLGDLGTGALYVAAKAWIRARALSTKQPPTTGESLLSSPAC